MCMFKQIFSADLLMLDVFRIFNDNEGLNRISELLQCTANYVKIQVIYFFANAIDRGFTQGLLLGIDLLGN